MPTSEKRESFENFKSNMCHFLKSKGDIDFLLELLEKNLVIYYYDKGNYSVPKRIQQY